MSYLTVADLRKHREELRKLPQPKYIAVRIHPNSQAAEFLREAAADPKTHPENRAIFQAWVDKLDGEVE